MGENEIFVRDYFKKIGKGVRITDHISNSGIPYYLIQVDNYGMYYTEGESKLKAWKNAKNKIIEENKNGK